MKHRKRMSQKGMTFSFWDILIFIKMLKDLEKFKNLIK